MDIDDKSNESFTRRMLIRRASLRETQRSLENPSVNDSQKTSDDSRETKFSKSQTKAKTGFGYTREFSSFIQRNSSLSRHFHVGKLDAKCYAPFIKNKGSESEKLCNKKIENNFLRNGIRKSNAVTAENLKKPASYITSAKIDFESEKEKWKLFHNNKKTSNKDLQVLEHTTPQLVKVQLKELDTPGRFQVELREIKTQNIYDQNTSNITKKKVSSSRIANLQKNHKHFEKIKEIDSPVVSSMTNLLPEIKILEKQIESSQLKHDMSDVDKREQLEAVNKVNTKLKFMEELQSHLPKTFFQCSNGSTPKHKYNDENVTDNVVNVNLNSSVKFNSVSSSGGKSKKALSKKEERKKKEIKEMEKVGTDIQKKEDLSLDDELMGELNLIPSIALRCKQKENKSLKRSSNLFVSKSKSSVPSPTIPNTNTEKTVENLIPIEVERFLQDALGDELYSTSSSDSPVEEITRSQLNPSKVILNVTNTKPQSVQACQLPVTDFSSNSNTINRSRTIYKSFTHSIKKKLRPNYYKNEYELSDKDIALETENELSKFTKLNHELDKCETMIYQTSKALSMCYVMKEFIASPEHVESERLLLLSYLQKKAYLEEMARRRRPNKGKVNFNNIGEIIIEDIKLPLKDTIFDTSKICNITNYELQWFVVSISYGSIVWMTQAVSCHNNLINDLVSFPESFSISNLSPNFKIIISIYNLCLNTSKELDETNHQNSTLTNTYSIFKFWKRSERPVNIKLQPTSTAIRDPSFKLYGSIELGLVDMYLSSPWKLTLASPNSSIIEDTICFKLNYKLHISITHEGFITYGDESGEYVIWNRWWCMLEGHIIKFWNYPQDYETKKPVFIIDMMQCVSPEVTIVDRSICAKPKTLLVKTFRPKDKNDKDDSLLLECKDSYTIVRHLLSYDNKKDLTEWKSKLNHILLILKKWNAIKSPSTAQVSDL